jgi:hypothetical protein
MIQKSTFFRFLAVSAVATPAVLICAQLGQAGEAELHPAEISGQVSFSGHTVSNVYAYAWSNDGYSANGSFSGDTYALTVEGGHDYRVRAEGRMFDSGVTKYLQVTRNAYVDTPVGVTRTEDFVYDVGTISGDVEVIGGTVTSLQIYATAAEGDESYSARIYDSSSGLAREAFSFPMVPDTSVRVYGNATLTTTDGVRVVRPLEQVYIDHDVNGSVLNWDFDLSDLDTTTGSLAGDIALTGDAESSVNSHRVYAYGVYNTPTQGVSVNQYVQGNGQYLIENLLEGDYNAYAYSYLSSPSGYIRHPYGSNGSNLVSITAPNTTTRDFSGATGEIVATLAPSGFVDVSDFSYMRASAYGVSGSPSGGGYAYRNNDAGSGDARLQVTPGDWVVNSYNARLYDGSDPNRPLNSYLYIYDYQAPSSPVSVGEGTRTQLPALAFETVETSIFFDVIEPAGAPEQDIRNPRLSGWAYHYDEAGQVTRRTSLNSYGSSQSSPTPEVRLVGEPGVYTIDAYGYVDNANVKFATFTLTLEVPQDTPAGTDILVEPSETVDLTFDNVVTPGVTTVTESPIGPEEPAGFRMSAPGGERTYYDITTTATFDGDVKVCINYDDVDENGDPIFVPASREDRLKLFHYDSATATWENITLAGSPDTENNVLCGLTDSFSLFAIMEPLDIDGDDVIGEDDNCPDDYNPDQADLDGDGQGDVCDLDDDGDGIPDDVDNCPTSDNGGQGDLDGDGIGDSCDPDDDGDDVADEVDNCPLTANPGQSDFDGDLAGDACDDDDDDDGYLDVDDSCAATELGAHTDGAGCSSAQRLDNTCPSDGEYRNHGAYIRCISHETEAQVNLGLITEEEKDAIVSQAAGSSIGKKK